MNALDFKSVVDDFKNNQTPYYFISASNFNLINLHQWVNRWLDINTIDCFDGQAPHALLPSEPAHRVFESVEDINQYLLDSPEVLARIEQDLESLSAQQHAKVIFLFFDEKLEKRCKSLGLDIILPPNHLVKNIDNKITTTQIGNQAGVESVPNVLAKVDSYQTLCQLAKQHHLGHRWVIQSAYGDSGKTTYFIESEQDYQRYAEKIEAEDEVKVMKQIRCIGTAIEACATQHGTYVGPLLGELIGFKELTPYQGGWCGNELYQTNFSAEQRAIVHQKTQQLGDALYSRDYRGYFEVDYLLDLDDGEIYLGEINPRITGISALTNMSPFCQKTMPLFLFHLLEYADEPIPFTPEQYNVLSLSDGAMGTTSQMVLKSTQAELSVLKSAPASGVYRLDEQGQLQLVKTSAIPTDKGEDPSQIYLLRIMNEGEYVYKGGDLAILFLNTQLTEAQGSQLNAEAQRWIAATQQAFIRRPLTEQEKTLVQRYTKPSSIKNARD